MRGNETSVSPDEEEEAEASEEGGGETVPLLGGKPSTGQYTSDDGVDDDRELEVDVAVGNASGDSDDSSSIVPFLDDSELVQQQSLELRRHSRKRREGWKKNIDGDARVFQLGIFFLTIVAFSLLLLLVDRSFFKSSTPVFESIAVASTNSTS